MQRGTENKQLGGKGTEEEQVLKLMRSLGQIVLPRGWQKCFSPTLKTYLETGAWGLRGFEPEAVVKQEVTDIGVVGRAVL